MSTRKIFWALPLSVSLAFGACESDDDPTDMNVGPVTMPGGPAGGTTAGSVAGGTTGATVGGTTGATVGGTTGATPGGTTGATPGGTTGATPGGTTGATVGGTTGATPGGTTGGMTGATPGGTTGGAPGGAPGGGVALVKCDTEEGGERNIKPCGSFVSSLGVEFQLGPYGGQMDLNVGKGFETASEGGAELICGIFVASFGEDPEASERLLNVEGLDMTLHTVYRPANWPQGKVPIVTWGNGTCAQPEGYGGLLRYVASHGFFVVAPNMRFTGSGEEQSKAIDFALAANMDPQSPYYQKLDTEKIIAMGHSQGGLGTANATANDQRIKAALLFNGGTSATKPFLAMSGDRDLGTAEGPQAAMDYGSQVLATSQAQAAWLWYHMIPGSGHVTLMTQPERVSEATVAWAKYILLGDAESKNYFAGPNCKLCGKETEFRFGQKGIQ